MSQISTTIFSNSVILAGASGWVDMDFKDVKDVQFLLSMTYPTTHASTTGLGLKLKAGMGKLDMSDPDLTQSSITYALSPGSFTPSIIFADNYDTVTGIPAFPLNYSGPITINHYFYLSDMSVKWPEVVRLEFQNLDVSNPCTTTLRANL